MKMVLKLQNTILIVSLIFIFLLEVAGVSHASLSMKEVQYLFEKERGSLWEEATSKQQKDFLRDILGGGEYQEGKFKHKKRKSNESSGSTSLANISKRKEVMAPHNVRSKFEFETGIDWEDATEKEQKEYWKNYELNENVYKNGEKIRSYMIKADEEKRRLEYEMKKQDLKIRAELRAQARELRNLEKKLKREEAKRQMELKKQEMETRRIRSKSR